MRNDFFKERLVFAKEIYGETETERGHLGQKLLRESNKRRNK